MTKGVDIKKMNDFRGGVRGDLGISFCRYIIKTSRSEMAASLKRMEISLCRRL